MHHASAAESRPSTTHANRGAALATAFGAAVAMWAAGYFGRIPPPQGWLPPAALLGALVAIQVGAGVVLAKSVSARASTALRAGTGTALINLLILGSLLREDHSAMDVLVGAGGLIIVSALLALAGFAAGRLLGLRRIESINWTGRLAVVAVCGTFVLVIAGGLVTGHEAGLAVVDWPNTEGSLMFLYPLSRMTGGVYYEHAHRLYGALVGLTTIALAVQIWRPSSLSLGERAGVRAVPLGYLALAAVILVVIQGILGGLRVTGEFTLSTDAAETRPNLTLAVVHGVLAQIFLGLMVLLAAMTSTSWSAARNGAHHPAARTDQILSRGLVAVLLVQLVLGALYRHLNSAEEVSPSAIRGLLTLHISVAAIVLAWSLVQGVRQCTVHRGQPIIRRLGVLLLIIVNLQVALGVLALIAVVSRSSAAPIPPSEVIATTMHQATGALLFSLAVLSAAWVGRARAHSSMRV